MRLAIVNSMAPFVWGGAEELAKNLVDNLRVRGHAADLFRIPFSWDPFSGLPFEIARSKALRFEGFDGVISMKFPIYHLEAERHVTWLVHQYRQAYDLWGTGFGNIPDTVEGRAVRDRIIAADNESLRARDGLFTISSEISERLQRFNGIEARPLRAPLNDAELFTGGDYGNYILAPGRVNAAKRQSLAVEAMAHMPSTTKLIVAGPPESDADAAQLHDLVRRYGLEDRVVLDLRFLSRTELADYVNNCRAVVYLPFQEDSYGYVTMEAFEAGKAVITTTDSGELLDLVQHQSTGQVCAPSSEALAEAMATYFERPALARTHGQAGQNLWRGTGINWDENIARLLGCFA